MNLASVRATWSKVLWSSLRTMTRQEPSIPVPGPPTRGNSMVWGGIPRQNRGWRTPLRGHRQPARGRLVETGTDSGDTRFFARIPESASAGGACLTASVGPLATPSQRADVQLVHERRAQPTPAGARSALDDAHVRGSFDGAGKQRAVPAQPREGPDRPVGRLRSADAQRP